MSTPAMTPSITRNSSFAALPASQKLATLNSIKTKTPTDGDNDHERHVNLSDTALSFGFGELLKYGAGEGDEDNLDPYSDLSNPLSAGHHHHHHHHHEHPESHHAHSHQRTEDVDERDQVEQGQKTLKGTYIVRVGWDDVRGWLGEGGTLIGSSRSERCEWLAAEGCRGS